MPQPWNKIPEKKPPVSSMFKPFMDSVYFFLSNVDPVSISEDHRIATGASQKVRDGNAADTAEKCRSDGGCYV